MADSENTPAPRGRGAMMLAALRRAQEQPGAEPAETLQTPEPPKPRGRAAMLAKLAALKQPSVGSKESTPSSSTVSTICETLATTTINEPCLYRGSSGSQISASCNYIRLTTEADRGVFEYNVQFRPEVDAKSVRIRCVATNVGKIRSFDGGSILYLPIMLPQSQTEYECTNPFDNSHMKMIVTFVKKKRLGECLHLYNILLKRVMRTLLYSQIGRNYFDPNHTHAIPQHKLEVLPGYAVAVDEYEDGVMICLDTQHRVMRTQSVLDVLMNLRLMCKDRFKDAAYKQLVGASILTRYNNQTYKVDDIMWDASPLSTFDTRDGSSVSYIDYYKKHHGIDIQDVNQPLLLNVQLKKVSCSDDKVESKVCLIPELCYMTGLTDEMRADFKVMKDVAMYTRVTPNQRMSSLRTYLDNIEKVPEAKQILMDWGLRIEKATVDLLARILDPETILFGDGITGHAANADWNSLVTRNKILGPVDLLRWYVIYTQRDDRAAKEYAAMMQRIGSGMGMRIEKPRLYQLKDDRTATYVDAIKDVMSAEIQIMVFICPTSRDDRYSAIKRICCSQMPIASQVINSRTLSNQTKVRGIVQKIALQINCKLGGTLWSLRFPVTNWMVCGIDVYHSTSSKRSVCAFVASLNEAITRWYSIAKFQDQELSDQLKMAFAKALEKYREVNGTFPSNVVIFRDGVGDGQLKHCREYEVAQFEKCLADYKLTNVKLTMVVVQKRINTRLFSRKNRDLENPPPGTIVDNAITRRNWYDFFLVAQHVRQGTVTPTHYVVVHDSAKLKPDHVQKLAYKLCHLYYNWPGTIRVPAPCQYAHKLAYLVGQHIGKDPSNALSDRLYYL